MKTGAPLSNDSDVNVSLLRRAIAYLKQEDLELV